MSEEIKQEIIEQYKEFLNKLYGTEGTVTYEQAVRDRYSNELVLFI